MATQPTPVEEPITPLETNDNGEGAQTNERDHESDARQHGWVPKDEFKGDPNRWVDAETFNTRADEVMPLLKKQNLHLKHELADVKKQTRRIVDHYEKDRLRLLAEIETKIDRAVEIGDTATVKRLRKEEKDLGGSDAKPEYTKQEAMDAFEEFRDGNAWYDRGNLGSATDLEKDARAYADRMTERNLDKTTEMSPADFFKMIEGLVEEKYPTIRARPSRAKPPSDVAGATNGRAPRGTGRQFTDLPVEAQRAADKWIKQGLIKDRAAYVASYDWS